MGPLRLLAGPSLLTDIRRDGFDPQKIKIMPAASGGPKWLGLYHLDRAIAGSFQNWFADRRHLLHLVGSSIGTWRMAAHASQDPIAAFDRLWAAYGQYEWQRGTPADQTRRETVQLLQQMLGLDQGKHILTHSYMRLHVLCDRCRHLGKFNGRWALVPFFTAAGLSNAISRATLGAFFERTSFSDPRASLPGDWSDFPPVVHELSAEVMTDALVQSCAIPLLIPGGPVGEHAGVYRDGGIIDYHFDIPFLPSDDEGYIFYPHFSPTVIPGWFDKGLRRRRLRPTSKDRMLLLAPDPAFIASLPGGKIPDRKDFSQMDNTQRLTTWQRFVDASQALAQDWHMIVAKDQWAERLEAL